MIPFDQCKNWKTSPSDLFDEFGDGSCCTISRGTRSCSAVPSSQNQIHNTERDSHENDKQQGSCPRRFFRQGQRKLTPAVLCHQLWEECQRGCVHRGKASRAPLALIIDQPGWNNPDLGKIEASSHSTLVLQGQKKTGQHGLDTEGKQKLNDTKKKSFTKHLCIGGMQEFNYNDCPKNDDRKKHHRSESDGFQRWGQSTPWLCTLRSHKKVHIPTTFHTFHSGKVDEPLGKYVLTCSHKNHSKSRLIKM